MVLATFIRGLVKKNPDLKTKLKKSGLKLSPFQYLYQTISMTILSYLALAILFLLIFKKKLLELLFIEIFLILIIPGIYYFWKGFVDVKIRKRGRQIEGDLLFVSEYFLVSLESGLPLGNSIQRLAKIKRPGGQFFKEVFIDFKTGKDLEGALNTASKYSPSQLLKVLLKRLKDSLVIGVDLRNILVNFISEASEKKIIEIREYSKKINPIIMMYLLIGVVLPSLGVTFFILGAAILQITPALLKWILVLIFLAMFLFQYIAYSLFTFSKSTL